MKKILTICIINWSLAVTAQPKLSFDTINFKFDNNYSEKFELGKLVVPEYRPAKTANTIELNFIVLRAKKTPSGTPVFYLAGGPGNSGINALRSEKLGVFLDLQETRDVVLIDQRGTGITKPVLTIPDKMQLPFDKPLEDPASMDKYIGHINEIIGEAKTKGVSLDAYNTEENAADIDDIRKALNYDRIILWGHSYGTHLGLSYIKKFGQFVEKAVLMGVNGLNHRYRFPTAINSIFFRIDSLIKLEPLLAKDIPSFSSLLNQQLDKLGKNPVTASINIENKKKEITIGRMDLEAVIISNIGNTAFVRELPQLIYQLSKGNLDRVGQFAYEVKTLPKGSAMTWAMHYASNADKSRMDAIMKEDAQGMLRSAINYPFIIPGVSQLFSIKNLGDEFRKNPVSPVPVLFASGSLDGRTSMADAEEVRKGFVNSVHIIFNNCSHDFASPGFAKVLIDFISGKKLSDGNIENPGFDFYALNSGQLFSTINKTLSSEGIPGVKNLFDPTRIYLSCTSILPPVYRQLNEKKPEIALSLLKLNQEFFPKENWQLINAFADVAMAMGNKSEAIEWYNKSVGINPMNYHARLQLKKLQ